MRMSAAVLWRAHGMEDREVGAAITAGPRRVSGLGVDRGWRWCGSCLLYIMGESGAGCGELCVVDRCGTSTNGIGGVVHCTARHQGRQGENGALVAIDHCSKQ